MQREIWQVRVHGVAGTASASMLQLAPEVEPDASVPEHLSLTRMPEPVPGRRALSWSSLTSGKARHALYILLLPFMLSNVAGWMLPTAAASSGEGRSVGLRWRIGLVRLAACLVTVQFGTLMTLTGVDIVGRQGLAGRLDPASALVPWAAGAGVVLCGLIIWALEWTTHVRARPEAPSSAPPDDRTDRFGTADLVTHQHALWNTPAMARGLHHAHVSLLLGSVGGLISLAAATSCPAGDGGGVTAARAPLLSTCAATGGWGGWTAVSWLALILAGLAVVVALATVVVLSASREGRLPGWLRQGVRRSRVAGLVSLVLSAPLWAGSPAVTAVDWMPLARGLLVVTMGALLVVLAVLVVLGAARGASMLMLAAGVGALFGAGVANSARTSLQGDVEIPASFGWLAFAFVCVAVALTAIATAAFLRALHGTREAWAQAMGRPPSPMVAAMLAVRRMTRRPAVVVTTVGAVGALGGAGLIAVVLRLGRGMEDLPPLDGMATEGVETAASSPAAVAVALGLLVALALCAGVIVLALLRGWARLLPLLGMGLAVGAAVLVWRLRGSTLRAEDIVILVALTLPVGMVLTRMAGAWRDAEARKGLAVLWDLGTFWPRWFHPFSPPTYSDTAVTGLSTLLQEELPDRGILLAPHSQGTVIAAAAILHAHQAVATQGADGTAQTPEEAVQAELLDRQADGSAAGGAVHGVAVGPPTHGAVAEGASAVSAVFDRLALLTYGSPLRRHYAAMFPAMFSDEAFEVLIRILGGPSDPRWRNLYRTSDPIAGAIGHPLVDRLNGEGGLVSDGVHSGYWDEPEWDVAVDELCAAVEAGAAQPS